MQFIPLLVLLLPQVLLCNSLSSHFRQHQFNVWSGSDATDDPGDPLYLTPYITNGNIERARQLSMSNGLGQTSYSGFFTVNQQLNSNMYFIFFPAQNGNMSAPVLLWLQGGPGGSSLFGLFNEQGPLVIDRKGLPHPRNVTWNSIYHMLYIDNPVGTGYSFTDNKDGLSTSEEEVADNLYSSLVQFFTIYSDYQMNEFYITGESYAGKYVPAIGFKIHVANANNPALMINLKGIAIGDGLCDPENMVGSYADLAFNLGLVDEMQKEFIESATKSAVEYIVTGDFMAAFMIFDMLLNGDLYPYPTYFFNTTGSTNYFNILRQENPRELDYYVQYIDQSAIRRAMKVGYLSYGQQSEAVEQALLLDVMDTIRDWLSVLMDNYKVMLYNGQLDLIVGAPLTERFLQVLKWSGTSTYLQANRKVWKIGDDLAGYVRAAGNFYQVIVRGGGHLLPYDQPERSFNLIQLFVSGEIDKFNGNY